MKLFRNNQPEKPVRKRKAKTNSWFHNQTKNSDALLDSSGVLNLLCICFRPFFNVEE